MTWLFFAFMAPLISATVNFLDKYIVKGQNVDYKGMPIFAALTSFIVGSSLWIGQGSPIPGAPFQLLLLIFLGMFTFFGTVLYFKIINSVAVSKLIILYQITPVFVLILSWLFMGEHLTMIQIVGFLLVLIAAIGLAGKGPIHDDSKVPARYFLLILGVDIIYAATSVLLKYATESNSVTNVYTIYSWGGAIGAIILYFLDKSARVSFKNSLITLKKLSLVLIFLNEGLFNLGRFFSVKAASLTSVTLVNVIGSTQVFFGILYGWVLNKTAPTIFEEGNSKGLIKELILAAIMFTGVYLLY